MDDWVVEEEGGGVGEVSAGAPGETEDDPSSLLDTDVVVTSLIVVSEPSNSVVTPPSMVKSFSSSSSFSKAVRTSSSTEGTFKGAGGGTDFNGLKNERATSAAPPFT